MRVPSYHISQDVDSFHPIYYMRYQVMEESPSVIYHLFYMIIESKTKNKKQRKKSIFYMMKVVCT